MPTPTPGSDRRSPPASGLAIAAAICSAVACCPAASLVGMALGLAALTRIRKAPPGTVGGRRLAIFALLAGGVSLLIQFLAVEWGAGRLNQATQRELERSIDAAMSAVQSGDEGVLRDLWVGGGGDLPSEAVAEFGGESLRRYGRYRSHRRVLPTPNRVSGGGFEQAVIFSFSQRDLTGSVRYVLVPTMASYMPMPRLTEVVIDDQTGALSLGAGAARRSAGGEVGRGDPAGTAIGSDPAGGSS